MTLKVTVFEVHLFWNRYSRDGRKILIASGKDGFCARTHQLGELPVQAGSSLG